MRSIIALLSGCAIATGAQAQVTSVTAEATITRTYRPDVTGVPIVSTDTGTTLGGSQGDSSFGSASSFQSVSRVDPDAVYFKNANAAAGARVTVDSYTIVTIGFRNDGPSAITPSIASTIVPAGMGLYVSPNCLNNVASCGPGTRRLRPEPFGYFDPSVSGRNEIAGASFDFLVRSGGTVLYELKGSLGYVFDPATGLKSLVTDLDAASRALAGFRLSSPSGSDDEFGFSWDATPIEVLFPKGTLLDPGASSSITYETRVISYSFATCTDLLTGLCLTSYSAFGDPLGKVSSQPTLARALRSGATTGATSLNFDEFRFALPTFENGVLSYQPILSTSPVPEPSTWAMLIGGFGLVGAAMRRRRLALT